MEGKTVSLSVLIMFLVMAQNQVEARVCCQTRTSRRAYNSCRQSGRSLRSCLRRTRCRFFFTPTCPRSHPFYEALENSGGDDVNEYCNLGCEFSVCGDTSETVNEEALEKCTNGCSTFCAKSFQTAADQIELNQIAPDQIELDQIAPDQIA